MPEIPVSEPSIQESLQRRLMDLRIVNLFKEFPKDYKKIENKSNNMSFMGTMESVAFLENIIVLNDLGTTRINNIDRTTEVGTGRFVEVGDKYGKKEKGINAFLGQVNFNEDKENVYLYLVWKKDLDVRVVSKKIFEFSPDCEFEEFLHGHRNLVQRVEFMTKELLKSKGEDFKSETEKSL
jgi:hypothetical protein